jgi:glycosyltransferase involved in cell wall biosynthesis
LLTQVLSVKKEKGMKFKVMIDATTIDNGKDGLSQYIIGLINNLPAASFNLFEFTILINPGIEREELRDTLKSGRFIILTKKIKSIGPRRDWDMFWFFLCNKNRFNLFHSTSNQYPFFLRNGIATVHDIIFSKYLNAPWWTFNFARRYLNTIVKNSLYKSAAVIAVSGATKNELAAHYKLNSKINNKIRVIYEGWEHLLADSNTGEDDKTTATFNFSNYLFYVGGSRIHKNLSRLIKGFITASGKIPQNIKLVISGDIKHVTAGDINLVNELNKDREKIILTGFVSNTALKKFFNNADAFIFPSLHEGFGIPVLESFYFKKPLLCSNTTSLPEVAGDAALYFDPLNTEDIARAIVFFYENPCLWQSMVAKGQERLKLFSWKKMSEETVELYKKVLLNKKNG